MRKANYMGMVFEVVSEDTTNGKCRIKGNGMDLIISNNEAILEDVILEEQPEDTLPSETTPNDIVNSTPDVLTSPTDVEPKDLHQTEITPGSDLTPDEPINELTQQDVPAIENAGLNVGPQLSLGEEQASLPLSILDTSSLVNDREEENKNRRNADLALFKSKITKMLEELDDFNSANTTPEQSLTEDDGAGGIVTTGTGTQTSGIANYNARLGTSPVKRKDTTGI